MTLERKDETASAPEKKCAASGGKKPVIVYILVLFLVAFSLMVLSLLVHQRSNAEAMGRLQSSVSAMQEVQELQNRVIQLQEELAETQKSLASAQEEAAAQAELAAEAQEASDLLSHRVDALYDLYALQQQYLLRDFEGCRETIQAMEDGGMVEFLSDGGGAADVTSPALRYQELKEAVSALENRAP